MPWNCAVVGCFSRRIKGSNISFFRFPRKPKSGLLLRALDEVRLDRHLKWIAALHRDDFSDGNVKNARICSKHFVTGRPSDDPNDVDYVPSLNMGFGNCKSGRPRATFHRNRPTSDSTNDEIVKMYHNYSRITEEAPPVITEETNNENILTDPDINPQSIIETLKSFKQNKENTLLIFNNEAKVVITSENSTLREQLSEQVRKVLAESNGGNIFSIFGVEEYGTSEMNVKVSGMEEVAQSRFHESPGKSKLAEQDSEVARINELVLLKKKFNTLMDIFSRCPFCNFETDDKKEIIVHVKNVHFNLLPEDFTTEDVYKVLVKEMETHEKEEIEFPVHYLNSHFKISCQYCREPFPTIGDLIAHVKNIHETLSGQVLSEEQLESGMRHCTHCHKVLNNLEEYKTHVAQCILNPACKKVNREGIQMCPICGRTGTYFQIKSHMGRHVTKYFDCEVCGKTMSIMTNYKRHLKVHEKRGEYVIPKGKFLERKRKYSCPICGMALTSIYTYKIHRIKHEDERGIKCTITECNKVFITSDKLKIHMKTDHPLPIPEEKKYFCNDCGKRYPTQKDLLKHKGTHISNLRYKCGYCAKIFKSTELLHLHVTNKHQQVKRVITQEGKIVNNLVDDGLQKKKMVGKEVKNSGGPKLKNVESGDIDEKMCEDEDQELFFTRKVKDSEEEMETESSDD